MTEQTVTTARPVENWTYAGRRESTKHQPLFAWQDETGELRYYGKLKATVIGAVYAVAVERDGERVTVYPDSRRYTGDRVDADQRLEWEVADKLAMQSIESVRLERKHAADSEFEAAIAPLRELYARQRTYAAKAAFVALVISSL
jgi:hypothetical protein